MAIWLRAGRRSRYSLGADPATRAARVVLAVRRTGRAACQSVAHASRASARSRVVVGLRSGATPARDRPPRAGAQDRRRRRTQPDAEPGTRRATPRGTPARGAPRRPAEARDQADASIEGTSDRRQTAPRPSQTIAPQTGRK